jgi:Arc/MetJ-type ribon-helix-helix transcriptional regulator
MENRKQAVSIRMSASDVRKIKRLAERLGVRDSDIIRFAVKSMLGLGATKAELEALKKGYDEKATNDKMVLKAIDEAIAKAP